MIFLLWRGRMIVKQTSRSSLSSSSGSVRIELKPKIVNIDLGAEEELPIRKTPSAERWGNVRTPLLTKMQESGCAFHHRKPEVKVHIYRYSSRKQADLQNFATLGSNLGISTLLEILQSCKLDHKVA